ncbi:LOW QUALITY PROTEIN: uncharacterized protein LOC133838173 [Drosophila sulfurigaster albostrigata]|uniref:LOW QUALITY PROTEIN: uncharacterized protein LOC133838173 n=1 Tax=Drosophila sulfurigaster albostrigata TaxID=89887 RepID=UPI002D219A6C|nr:LOW QUALITY PROTEIN: uncharacterized protein LOC133838173 [Drosophila sulfurigaster albostrigata]
MNPICKTNINSTECQLWMNRVCTHCRDLFAKEATNTWAAWWHDDTPAYYKDVPEMTVYDCNKLKHLLELEVAAVHSNQSIAFPSKSFNFKLWQKILLICIYIGIIVAIILICYYWKLGRRDKDRPVDEEKEETPSNKYSKPDSSSLSHEEPPKHEKNHRSTLKGWMRYRCRPFFLHNEAALRRQQAKYREKELLREAYTQQNIEKWTRAREKVQKKRRDRETALEAKLNEIKQKT